MKTKTMVIIGICIVVFMAFVGGFNTQISLDENVNEAWGNVETQYQRRTDLIPNLVSTVKGYASHESETLEAVTAARQQVMNIKAELSGDGNISPETMAKFAAAQGQLSGSLSRLLATVEAYPDLKADQGFLDLQHQLEGTENRISVARQRYNESVKNVNKNVRGFFGRLVAVFSGVEKRSPFEAQEGAENAPSVSFD